MVLVFSSCLNSLELGFATDDFTLVNKETHNFKQQHSEFMISTISKFLAKNNTDLTLLNSVYFTNGPGSFTGNRLGVVFVKTLFVLNPTISVYTINTLSSLVGNKSGIFSLDARSGKYYSGKFEEGILKTEIKITDSDQSNINKNNNVIENMLSKFIHATKIDNLCDIKPIYVKEI